MMKRNCGWMRSNSVWEERSASGALISAKYFEIYQKKYFWHFEVVRSRLQGVVDNISLAENNKCYAISFMRMEAVVVLFSVLSGMPEGTVRSYFKRRVQNGRAKVIVNLEKDFVFLYKIKACQLSISFHYGLWNKSGFPLHS